MNRKNLEADHGPRTTVHETFAKIPDARSGQNSLKSSSPVNRPELLCPVGNKLALKAAVENGADAVYLGLKEFNARRSADNFSLEELKEAVDFAHLRRVKVYLAFNILVAEAELERAADYLVESYNAGIDGLIIQDWGIYELARKIVPGLPLHASTQMNVHNSAQAQFLEEKGFNRIVLARELSIEEIVEIRKNNALELETFIHGARCFSYSGQCLFSSMVGGRSGNRGLCTQPCRLEYELLSMDKNLKPIPAHGRFILSTKDLCAINLIPELVKAGLNSFKIEGRLKSAEYVATVTRIYRQAIDRYMHDPEHFEVKEDELSDLKEAFYRGFTEGFLAGGRGNDLMSYQQPSHRGLLVGRVSSVDVYSGKVAILLQRDLHIDDELEFWVSKGGRVSQKIKIIWVEGKDVREAKKGEKAVVLVAQKRHLIKPGDRVFRTFNQKLMQEAKSGLRKGKGLRKIPVLMKAIVKLERPVWLEIETDQGEKVSLESDFVVDRGKKKTVSDEWLKVQLGKMGGTPYEVTAWQIELDEGAILSYGQLNWLRRRLVEKLDEARLQPGMRKPARKVKTVADLLPARTHRQTPRDRKIELAVNVCTLDQIKAVVEAGADWVYFKLDEFCPAKDKDRLSSILAVSKFCRSNRCNFALSTPSILHDSELKEVLDVVAKAEEHLDAVVVANAGLAYVLRNKQQLILDYQLNLFEPLAYQAFAQFKPQRVTLSPELNQGQIRSMAEKIPVPAEILTHGSLEVLIAEHCIPLASAEKCQQVCQTGKWAVRDAKDYVFPLELDSHCRSHLFNSKELCLFYELTSLKDSNVGAVRLALERYPAGEAGAITRRYRQKLARVKTGLSDLQALNEEVLESSSSFSDYTRGHFHRGVQ